MYGILIIQPNVIVFIYFFYYLHASHFEKKPWHYSAVTRGFYMIFFFLNNPRSWTGRALVCSVVGMGHRHVSEELNVRLGVYRLKSNLLPLNTLKKVQKHCLLFIFSYSRVKKSQCIIIIHFFSKSVGQAYCILLVHSWGSWLQAQSRTGHPGGTLDTEPIPHRAPIHMGNLE